MYIPTFEKPFKYFQAVLNNSEQPGISFTAWKISTHPGKATNSLVEDENPPKYEGLLGFDRTAGLDQFLSSKTVVGSETVVNVSRDDSTKVVPGQILV